MLNPKSPLVFPESQNSLSRIIREQGLNYEQEVCGEDIQFDIKFNGHFKKQMKENKVYNNTKTKHFNTQENSPTLDSRKKQASAKIIQRQQYPSRKGQGYRRDNSPVIELKSIEKKRNIIDLNEIQVDQRISRKDKKDKMEMDEQKTKKIQFQDLDRSKNELERKKNSATKIKQKTKETTIDSWKQGLLQLCSNQSSDVQDQGQASQLFRNISQNNKILNQQLKQMMAMVKWEYIQAQKIDLRKYLSKLESEVRKMKIGFRGLSQSTQNRGLGSKLINKSKIKLQQPISKQKVRKSEEIIYKSQSKLQKEKPLKNIHSLKDYGFDPFQIQQNQLGSQQQEKLQRLTEQLEKQKQLSARLALNYNEVSARLKKAKEQNQLLGSDSILKGENKVSNSVIKRSKIIKEKLVFLKNEIKQTKMFYSNRIKRLKNENNINYNETRYVEKEIEQIKAILTNGEPIHKNNLLSGQNNNHKKLNLDQLREAKPNALLLSNAKTASSNRQATTIKSVQSLENIKSIQSINSVKSLESCNSNQNNLKIKRNQAGERQSTDYQMNSKPKLKLNSPHLTPLGNGANIKQYSILTKRKRQTEERMGRSGQQRNNSLDIAFKQLQQKYSVQVEEPNYEAEYYYGSKN